MQMPMLAFPDYCVCVCASKLASFQFVSWDLNEGGSTLQEKELEF